MLYQCLVRLHLQKLTLDWSEESFKEVIHYSTIFDELFDVHFLGKPYTSFETNDFILICLKTAFFKPVAFANSKHVVHEVSEFDQNYRPSFLFYGFPGS